MEEKIIASTYGRGVWESTIPIQIPDNEVRLVSITPNSNEVLCDSFTPTATVENQGLNTITQIDITYTINNNPEQTFTWTGNLLSNATETIALPIETSTNFGNSNISITATITNDSYSDNNTLENSIFS